MIDQKKPGRRTLILKGKGSKQAAPGAPEKPQAPTKPTPASRPKGPPYTPPKAHEPLLKRFWLVMRSNGRRPHGAAPDTGGSPGGGAADRRKQSFV
jgi:hypothetical protein